MDIDALLKSIEGWGLATAIREGLYLFPFLESIHVIGLAIVFGTILIIDLRLLGVASANRPFQRMAPEIIKWTWVGFAVTVLTGARSALRSSASSAFSARSRNDSMSSESSGSRRRPPVGP